MTYLFFSVAYRNTFSTVDTFNFGVEFYAIIVPIHLYFCAIMMPLFGSLDYFGGEMNEIPNRQFDA